MHVIVQDMLNRTNPPVCAVRRLTGVDLSDANFHIPIGTSQSQCLQLAPARGTFRFTLLACCTFTQCMDAAMNCLRPTGLGLLNYSCDWLTRAQS